MVDYVHNYGGGVRVSVQGIRTIATAATTVLGSVKALAHGKEVVYAKLSTAAGSAAIGVGFLMQAPAAVANHGRRPVSVTASIGEKKVKILFGATSAAQDEYKDGIMIVECGTGTGYSYMIQANPAFDASSCAWITLKDGIEQALNTASLVTLLPNKYRNILTKPDSAVQTGPAVGVTLVSAALTNGGYVWLGKCGEWPSLVEGTLVVGQKLTVGSAAGTVGPVGTATDSNFNFETVGILRATSSITGGRAIVDFKL